MKYKLGFLLALSANAGSLQAAGTEKAAAEDDNIIRRIPEESIEPRIFTKAEQKKVCEKYVGRYISVYGEIFKIENCTRRPLPEADDVFTLNRQGVTIVEVESKDVAAIPIGAPYIIGGGSGAGRDCKEFNGKYITFSYTDIYYVERCLKKLVPDWETYLVHRKEKHVAGYEIYALTAKEFYGMKQGRDVTSIINKEFAKLLDGSAGVDVIPIDEACKGVEGKIVSFYSKMYKIEKCRKREMDPEVYLKAHFREGLKIVELRSEQWLSLPDGVPVVVK